MNGDTLSKPADLVTSRQQEFAADAFSGDLFNRLGKVPLCAPFSMEFLSLTEGPVVNESNSTHPAALKRARRLLQSSLQYLTANKSQLIAKGVPVADLSSSVSVTISQLNQQIAQEEGR